MEDLQRTAGTNVNELKVRAKLTNITLINLSDIQVVEFLTLYIKANKKININLCFIT